jgi:hypothetical protein
MIIVINILRNQKSIFLRYVLEMIENQQVDSQQLRYLQALGCLEFECSDGYTKTYRYRKKH